MRKIGLFIIIILLILASIAWALPYFGINFPYKNLLPGFNQSKAAVLNSDHHLKITKYLTDLKAPRFMLITDQGDLIVAETGADQVILIPYGQPHAQKILVDHLNRPHSIDIYQDHLYIAERNAIGKIKFDAKTGKITGSYTRVITSLPSDGMHWTRTLKFGADGYGYVSIGSSCNVCIEKNPLRASLQRFKPGEYQLRPYATGLRNTVGFDWSPVDGQLYGTDNGRDWLGDHFPPDELNQIQKGHFYGWPYANGNNIPDPDYGKNNQDKINEAVPPVHEFGAHNAPLGITFIKNPKSPYFQQALVALHGSWNSSTKVGYKVVALRFNNHQVQAEEVINFLKQGQVLGRPVHIVEGKRGELYLSDDYNGVVYQLDPAQ